jgi:shikimate dehydrogenase
MRRFGLIGFPLSHSFSKNYFTTKFGKEGINNAQYDLFPIENIAQLPELIRTTPGLEGLNVTIPYKEAAISYLDELDKTASDVGAVNTICIQLKDNRPYLKGYNTDVFGFRQSIKPFLESHHERALILGSGGASKAVAHVLKEIGVAVYFVTRKKTPGIPNMFEYAELNEHIIRHFPLIINTTPLGMYPNVDQAPDIPYQLLTDKHFLYDLIYNPEVTRFMAEGKKRGTPSINGLSMLQQQAEMAWKIWNKER